MFQTDNILIEVIDNDFHLVSEGINPVLRAKLAKGAGYFGAFGYAAGSDQVTDDKSFMNPQRYSITIRTKKCRSSHAVSPMDGWEGTGARSASEG